MKKLLNVTYFLLITILLSQCSNEYQLPDNLVVKDFVWKGLNAYYLYQEEIADLSDRRFSSDQELNTYLSNSTDYNSLFNSLLIPLDVKSSLLEDYSLSAIRDFFANETELDSEISALEAKVKAGTADTDQFNRIIKQAMDTAVQAVLVGADPASPAYLFPARQWRDM